MLKYYFRSKIIGEQIVRNKCKYRINIEQKKSFQISEYETKTFFSSLIYK
jgi:hypothetical protein